MTRFPTGEPLEGYLNLTEEDYEELRELVRDFRLYSGDESYAIHLASFISSKFEEE